jgi:hypothetical protein
MIFFEDHRVAIRITNENMSRNIKRILGLPNEELFLVVNAPRYDRRTCKRKEREHFRPAAIIKATFHPDNTAFTGCLIGACHQLQPFFSFVFFPQQETMNIPS